MAIYGHLLRGVYKIVRNPSRRDIGELFEEGTLIDNALKEAVRRALLYHKRNGNSVVTWRNGKVVWIPADQIEVNEEPGG